MPVLFGNTYILPAIVVVVLLLVLILVLALRARAAAGRNVTTAAPKSERPATARPRPTRGAKASEPVAPSPAPKTPSHAPEPSRETAVPAAVTAAFSAPDSSRRESLPLPGSDPLRTVIVDILHGWGDVTEEDTNRLSLFRPDKVLAAVKSMEVPKELKSNKYARGRLGQLRQFAEKSAEEHKDAAVASAAAATVAPPTAPWVPEEPTSTDAAPAETPPETPSELEAEIDDVEALGGLDATGALDDVDDVEALAGIDAGRLGVPADEGLEIVEEAPLETIEEIPLEFEEELPFESTTQPVVEAPRADDAPVEPSSPATATQPAPAVSFLDEPEDAVSGLIGSVRTADDLFALPPQDQTEMVAFLQPEELSNVFQRTKDPELKKAIIDTLEHVSNPASLEMLRRCLDDPDPRIQLYALEAADRLLGVD